MVHTTASLAGEPTWACRHVAWSETALDRLARRWVRLAMPRNDVLRAALAASLALVLAPGSGSAQAPARETPEPVCLGFSFGKWTPALDWKAAGHAVTIDPNSLQRAADGRDWATTQAVESESIVVLLPSWWPAGVSVTLPNRAPAMGDTVVGSAFAYVADGRRAVPTARARAWRVPCASRAP
jgi:hypothetical protein